MDDDELRRVLTGAAERFPVGGGPGDLRSRVTRRRRNVVGLFTAVSAAAAAVLIAALVLSGSGHGPAAQSMTGTGYAGSTWRLTSVAKAAAVTAIPASIGARLSLGSDGRFLANDGVNTLSGKYASSADGFTVSDVASTAVGYAGGGPQLTAITAINALAGGRDRVIDVSGTRLVVQAGPYRLTFVRARGSV